LGSIGEVWGKKKKEDFLADMICGRGRVRGKSSRCTVAGKGRRRRILTLRSSVRAVDPKEGVGAEQGRKGGLVFIDCFLKGKWGRCQS